MRSVALGSEFLILLEFKECGLSMLALTEACPELGKRRSQSAN